MSRSRVDRANRSRRVTISRSPAPKVPRAFRSCFLSVLVPDTFSEKTQVLWRHCAWLCHPGNRLCLSSRWVPYVVDVRKTGVIEDHLKGKGPATIPGLLPCLPFCSLLAHEYGLANPCALVAAPSHKKRNKRGVKKMTRWAAKGESIGTREPPFLRKCKPDLVLLFHLAV